MLTDGRHACAPADMCGRIAVGGACSVNNDCLGGPQGDTSCVNFGGSVGALCEDYCQSGSDCGTGCCTDLTNGQRACAPTDQCQGATFPDPTEVGHNPVVLEDPQGTLHLLETADEVNTYPVRYGECAGDCRDAANWSFITLGNHGLYGGFAHLALDPSGHPRVLYLQEGSGTHFIYATCDAGCTNAANWTSTTAATGDDLTSIGASYTPYFAIDHQGRPAFFYQTYDATYYASCQSNCTQSSSWSSLALNLSNSGLGDFDLTFTSSGAPRVLFRQWNQISGCNTGDALGFLACDADCSSAAANWHTTLFYCTSAAGRLQLNASDQPRIVFYDHESDALPYLTYGWCDGNCTTASSWSSRSLGLGAGSGTSADLALDAQSRPIVAYEVANDPYALGIASCSAGCETSSGSWSSRDVETSASLAAETPPYVPSGCDAAYWYPGTDPSIALRASGAIGVAYDVTSLETCSGQVQNGPALVRFGVF